MKQTLFSYWLIIFFCFGFSNSLSYAEAVNYATAEQIHSIPIKKGKKIKQKKKWFSKKTEKTQKGIVFSLYVTFAILFLLPILIILGITLVGVGFPSFIFLYSGIGLILLGNTGAFIAGSLAGATKQYSSQILSFGLWILFGINLFGAMTLLLLNLLLFSSLLIWVLIAVMFLLALFSLIWALIIRQQNRVFRNNNTSSTNHQD